MGMWGARACTILWRAGGFGNAIFSPWAVYVLGRCVDSPSYTSPIYDIGARPNDVCRAIEEFGVAPIDAWPVSLATVNQRPTEAQMAACEAFDSFLYRKIYTLDADLVLDVKRALASGLPVGGHVDVDQGLLDYSGGVLGASQGNNTGARHMLTVWGYDGDIFYIDGSWGRVYGEQGVMRVSPEFLFRMQDFTVLRIGR